MIRGASSQIEKLKTKIVFFNKVEGLSKWNCVMSKKIGVVISIDNGEDAVLAETGLKTQNSIEGKIPIYF